MKLNTIEECIDLALSEKSVIQLDWGPIFYSQNRAKIECSQYYDFLKYFTYRLQNPMEGTNRLKSLISSSRSILDYDGTSIHYELENLDQYPKNYEDLINIIKKRQIDSLIYPINGNFVDEIIKDISNLNYDNSILKFNQKLFQDFNSQNIQLDHLITCSKDFKLKTVGIDSIEHVRNEVILKEIETFITNFEIFKFHIVLAPAPYITFCYKKYTKTFYSK